MMKKNSSQFKFEFERCCGKYVITDRKYPINQKRDKRFGQRVTFRNKFKRYC